MDIKVDHDMLGYLPDHALLTSNLMVSQPAITVAPSPPTDVESEDENYNLVDWMVEMPDHYRRRKCVLFSLCFSFILYPTSVLVLLICGDTCLDMHNDVTSRNFVLILVSFFGLVHIFLSTLCMFVLFPIEGVT